MSASISWRRSATFKGAQDDIEALEAALLRGQVKAVVFASAKDGTDKATVDLRKTNIEGARGVRVLKVRPGRIMVRLDEKTETDFRVDAAALGLDPSREYTDLIAGDPVARVLPNHPDKWRPIPAVRPYATHVIELD